MCSLPWKALRNTLWQQTIVQHQTRQILPMEEFESLTGLGVRGKI